MAEYAWWHLHVTGELGFLLHLLNFTHKVATSLLQVGRARQWLTQNLMTAPVCVCVWGGGGGRLIEKVFINLDKSEGERDFIEGGSRPRGTIKTEAWFLC